MSRILESWPIQIYMIIITIYSLFFDDIRILYVPKEGDDVFYSLHTLCFVSFSVEIFLAFLANREYWCGFFFWLDMVSTVSLLTDIGWIMNDLISNSSGWFKLGKSSRAGWVTWVIWVVRLIWLIRIVKLYK